MTVRMRYPYDHKLTREWTVGANVPAGTAVLSASNQPGVTITASGGSTATITAGSTSITYPSGGVGNATNRATVATDGSWEFPVTGASSSTPENTIVYAVVSGGAVTSLTLTVGSNVKFGVVDNYPAKATAGATTVKIGVFA